MLKLLLFLLPSIIWASIDDPYKQIEKITLSNGLTVYLAPLLSEDKVNIKVKVKAGFNTETEEYRGASHLLEHLLFRSKDLKDDTSYLELIKDKGGQGNGTTNKYLTQYFASVKSSEGQWLLDLFYKMLSKTDFLEEQLDKEKRAVFLEIGLPSPLEKNFGLSIGDLFSIDYLKRKGFWEKEFGYDFSRPYTDAQEKYNTALLTSKMLVEYYRLFYYPENMTIHISGKFDKAIMLKQLNNSWAKLNAAGKKSFDFPKLNTNNKEFYSANITNDSPTLSIGYTFDSMDLKKSVILSSYFRFFAHRMHKEFRNKKGQAYSVNPSTNFFSNIGLAYINLNTNREDESEVYALISKKLHSEVEQKRLSQNTFIETKSFIKNKILINSKTSKGMEFLSEVKEGLYDRYQENISPIEILDTISFKEYQDILYQSLKKENRYTERKSSNIFFRYDIFLFILISFISAFAFFKKITLKSFENAKVKWVRKVYYPPFFLVEISLIILTFFIFSNLQFFIFDSLLEINFVNKLLIFKYLYWLIFPFSLLLGVQLTNLLYPRKLYLVEELLIIKHLTYYSKKIKISEISSVKSEHWFTFLCTLSNWKSLYRFYHFDIFKFWRRGIQIDLNNGKRYFFASSNAQKAVNELNSFLKKEL